MGAQMFCWSCVCVCLVEGDGVLSAGPGRFPMIWFLLGFMDSTRVFD